MRDDGSVHRASVFFLISIHVPRMRDDCTRLGKGIHSNISIHVPRMRDDKIRRRKRCFIFNFNPRPSHEGRRWHDYCWKAGGRISIHVPRMRDDGMTVEDVQNIYISIHVPRMRDDWRGLIWHESMNYFNPRPSHEGRLGRRNKRISHQKFQSTSLA